MASIEDEGRRWMARVLSWERMLSRLRSDAPGGVVAAPPDPPGEAAEKPVSGHIRIDDWQASVPRHDDRVASPADGAVS